MHSVMVPLDGSPLGECALPYALALARQAGARVELVHVHAPPDSKHPEWYLPSEERSGPDACDRQLAYLEGFVQRFAAAGVTASSALATGLTGHALCEHAVSTGADLIVMATRGRGPLARFWLGSVADEML